MSGLPSLAAKWATRNPNDPSAVMSAPRSSRAATQSCSLFMVAMWMAVLPMSFRALMMDRRTPGLRVKSLSP